MKKLGIVLLMLCLLTAGCATEETFETVSDALEAGLTAQRRSVYVELPGDAASPAVESDAGRLYLCGDYEIQVQILAGGDVDATLRSLTGFEREALTVVQTSRDGGECYEFVFASTGEPGQTVGKGMILDDGGWHYCLMVQSDAETAAQNQAVWEEMFQSFRLA